eukprot:CAMPEP_0119139140 /NCGR_PEP_ID=MMETSP1310-20130426/26962_1 /TAXON_ID=464262 /ORGANISM="Genus nov. species nov., Strain RCC2339" /LENGTH=1099 /DNA_ID=CAMNT_0007130403 /DNA_START=156 /DNA_END=3452 /DNA_ORIENTATION=+
MADKKDEENQGEENTAKRDFLQAVEGEVQARWEKEKAWELDALEEWSEDDKQKCMVCFPYPYMNGRLHLGHGFTISKADFFCGYQLHKGKRALFPFAYHATGMPIKACADKLAREMEEFGTPPKFPEAPAQEEKKEKAVSADPLKFGAKKSKEEAKFGSVKYQWKIMQQLGIPDEDIPKFADAAYWLKFFPPRTQDDLRAMGCKIDHRRAFVTTDINPYYDSFVSWQFNRLKELGYCEFGPRYVIWSQSDGQACLDHERTEGENVKPQEYTVVKLEVQEPYPETFGPAVGGKKVSLVAATLRPETMYGQTNCWVLPEGEYGVYNIGNDEYGVCSARAAENMAYQGQSPEFGKVECVATVSGQDLVGLKLTPPNWVKYDTVYALPMLTVLMDKGTGVVTSVPSDSPMDWRALKDLKEKPALREKYGVKDEWVLPFDSVDIIEVPDMKTTRVAEKVCVDLKINSQNDPNLAEAKDVCYKAGFNKGKMLVGSHAGRPVAEVKAKMAEELVEQGLAFPYAEPADRVVSRSGDVCVVARAKQWYLPYGKGEWLERTSALLEKMRMYGAEAQTHQFFREALDWLGDWPFSRTYGLGTKIPWDEQYLVESLSDSTVYMSYYGIAHLLQGGVLDGNGESPVGVKAEQMTAAVWDYVLLGRDFPKDSDIPEAVLRRMRNEVEYWYPYDVRVSGKDLIKNHLTFAAYHHVALFPEKHWPAGVRTNGFLLLNGKKMSKSAGNFLTLRESTDKYSADGTRLALAEAGDSNGDSNFTHNTANAAILRLSNLLELTKDFADAKASGGLRTGEYNFADSVFAAHMDAACVATEKGYDNMDFREGLVKGPFQLKLDHDSYVNSTKVLGGPHVALEERYFHVTAVLFSPITPHVSQRMWELLGHDELVARAPWPKPVLSESEYLGYLTQDHWLQGVLTDMRKTREYDIKTQYKKDGSFKLPEDYKGLPYAVSRVIVYISEYPAWQQEVTAVLQNSYDAESNTMPDMKALSARIRAECPSAKNKKLMNNIMRLLKECQKRIQTEGAEALRVGLPFSEVDLFQKNMGFMKHTLEAPEIVVVPPGEAGPDPQGFPKRKLASPGHPLDIAFILKATMDIP